MIGEFCNFDCVLEFREIIISQLQVFEAQSPIIRCHKHAIDIVSDIREVLDQLGKDPEIADQVVRRFQPTGGPQLDAVGIETGPTVQREMAKPTSTETEDETHANNMSVASEVHVK
jgi:hypothetical protein